MDGLGKNQKLAPSLLCVAGLFAFIGSSSAWIRVSFIQIRGLDYWFGFVTAISACAIITSGIASLRPHLVTPKWRKNWTIYSLLSSIASITILLTVATRVNKINEEISKRAELSDSIVGELLLGVLGRIIGKATTTIAGVIQPKLAEGFYITITSFFLAAILSTHLTFTNSKK